MRRFGALAAVALVLLAGCTAAVGPRGGAGTPADPDPPYESAGELPGVENGTVADPAALVAANAAALSGHSYVAVTNWSTRFWSDRPSTRKRTVSRVDAGGTWRVERAGWYTDGGDRYFSMDVWSNGSVAAVRDWEAEDEAVVYRAADVTHAPNESLAANFVAGYLGEGDYRFRRTVERNGTRLFVFVADGYVARVAGDRANDSFRGRLVVDEGGRIRAFSASYGIDDADDGRPARITLTYDLHRVGSADPERPGWLDEAREAGALVACEDDTADYECTN